MTDEFKSSALLIYGHPLHYITPKFNFITCLESGPSYESYGLPQNIDLVEAYNFKLHSFHGEYLKKKKDSVQYCDHLSDNKRPSAISGTIRPNE
jgi:hypothetical protein